MAQQNVIQTSFASGELSPNIFAHVDMEQYHTGAAMMRNFFVDYRSGASTRAGTAFVVQAFNSALPVRVIPFQTSILVPYVLEFGDKYMRPLSEGAPVFLPPVSITGVTQGTTTILTAPGHTYVDGDWVLLTGIGGTVQLNDRYFVIESISGSQLTVFDTYGNPVDSTNYGTYTSGGQTNKIYQIASPYAAVDLALLKFVQVANVMYLTHPSYPPYVLTFASPTNWGFSAFTAGSTVGSPGTPTITVTAAGNAYFSYVVTAVDGLGQESSPSPPGGSAASVDIGATAGTLIIDWSAVSGAAGYNVYKAENGIGVLVPGGASYGFITSTTGTEAIDSNIVPDFTTTPPNVKNPFAGGNDPGCAAFFQQRLYFAGSNQFPQTFWGSQPGYYTNFNTSNPIQAADAITGTLVSLQVNYIKAMVPMPGGLIMLTSGGAWQLSSGTGGLASTAAVTPINATATPQAYNGISDVPPIIINQDVLYVQFKNSIVRDLEYNIYANIYTGSDVSVLSNHLFFGYQITQWAYAEEPFKVIWCVRNDGEVLSFTYLKEQKLHGWARHDTQGRFKSVATVTEGNFDATYFVVERLFGGNYWQFIERMDDRKLPYGAEDAWGVDCGSQTGGQALNGTLSVSASTGTHVVFFVADNPVFTPDMVGKVIRAGGGIATITQFVSPNDVFGDITQPITAIVPNDPLRTPVIQGPGQWTVWTPVTTVIGLDYLEEQTVSILADGNVLAPQVVENGSITLEQPATKVTVGLAFIAQLQTMPLDLGDQKDSIQGKRKKISALSIRLSQTRGLSFGQSFVNMTPIKEWSQGQFLGQTIPLVTGDERVIMDPLWDVPGQICLQQDNPLPATILGVIPEVTVGDTVR
jgi:hypothetical protein